jgi:lipid II:glycine glycyltransferase (peptidoglycan interpeptide bridge formation enzyme)
MIKSFFTKEQQWLDKWDEFLQKSNRGLYNQLSDWIKSYQVYGFDYGFYLLTNNEKIVGGCGFVIAKFSFFKFLIVPCGPVIEPEFESQIDSLIIGLKDYAQKKGCCYFQINLPLIKTVSSANVYTLTSIAKNSIFYSGIEGTKFKYVIPLFGMRNIDLEGKSLEEVIQNYNSNHKRKSKKIKEYDFQFQFVSNEDEIAKAYQCFVLNAEDKGYPIRSFDSIKNTLKIYLDKDFAKIGICKYNNQIIGAIYVMKCGNRLIYINGGILKEYQNLPVSIFLHNQIISYSLSKNYSVYDISVGGSSGVIRFKEGFGSHLIEFENSRYWIIKPTLFSFYNAIEKKLRNHKQIISKLLFIIKKGVK